MENNYKQVLLGKGVFYAENEDGPMRLLIASERFSQIGNLVETLNAVMDATDFSGAHAEGRPFIADITAMMNQDAELLHGQDAEGNSIEYYETVDIEEGSITIDNLDFLEESAAQAGDEEKMKELIHDIKAVPFKNWNPDARDYLLQKINNER